MSIRDSVCVLGGVLLGCGIPYKMLRVQSAHLKQLQALQANCKQLEEKQYEDAEQTRIIEAKLEEHIKYEKTVTKQLQDKLEEIQTHQTIDKLTVEIDQINKKIESSTHEESPVEVKEESISKGPRGNYHTSNQSSISSQHDLEEDIPIDQHEVEEDRSVI
ncbi:unnamed protein product [Mytilus coruscus]|uniref:Uncharacterized protein n=1 Tax=Mytilus coruscus TaxID=42192 RepID=A0A6J8BZP9_MYTCO|nr:unnamed protein product [Mytilus coruscus]